MLICFAVLVVKNIKSYVSTVQDIHDEYHTMITSKLMELTESFNPDTIINIKNDVSNIVSLQKALLSVEEIHQNKLIGKYNYIDGTISFITKSFSVIDYINAILGNDYIQCGGTLNAKWFGVPQYRRRHAISRILYFWILPLAVIGNVSMNQIYRGIL